MKNVELYCDALKEALSLFALNINKNHHSPLYFSIDHLINVGEADSTPNSYSHCNVIRYNNNT